MPEYLDERSLAFGYRCADWFDIVGGGEDGVGEGGGVVTGHHV